MPEEKIADGSVAKPMPDASASHVNLFFNRESSLLAFFRRVLEEATDETQPLLERLKFLAIFSSYIDEFFMIRVSALRGGREEHVTETSVDGKTPDEQLRDIRLQLLPMLEEHARCLREDVLPRLADEGITLARFKDLNETERQAVDEYFQEQVLLVLTPLAVDSAHPFPNISNLSLNLGLMVEPRPELGVTRSLTGRYEPRFVRIKVPTVLPRLVPIGDSATKFILLEDLIASKAQMIFPRMKVGACHPFRITRDADIKVLEEEAEDLLQMMELTLRRRRFGAPVRLEVTPTMPPEMVSYLTQELELNDDDVYMVDGLLNVGDLMSLYKLDRPELKDPPFEPQVHSLLASEESIFDIIKKQDVLLHHPYDSYSSITDFIRAAAADPNVLTIKMCLYRTGQNSPIPKALIEASAANR